MWEKERRSEKRRKKESKRKRGGIEKNERTSASEGLGE